MVPIQNHEAVGTGTVYKVHATEEGHMLAATDKISTWASGPAAAQIFEKKVRPSDGRRSSTAHVHSRSN